MSIRSWRMWVGLGAAICGLALAAPVMAQQTRQPLQVNPTADSVNEQKLLDALKGAPAVSGRISIPDTRAGNLIQPGGRDWRVWRDTTLPRTGAILIVGMLVALIAFLVIRGRIKVDGGLAGQQVERFTSAERFGHWLTATSFVVLAITGLNVTYGRQLLLPVMGADGFTAFSQIAKYLHNYMSFAFVLGLVMLFLMWVIYNFPSFRDITWIAQGGGIFGKSHPPAAKFNAGQKLVFWITILGGGLLAITGYMLMFPFYSVPSSIPGNLSTYTATIDGIQTVSVLHGLIALFMIAVILGHIYIGTIGMQGAFWSMGTGKVDANWARQHHSVWAERVLGKGTTAKNPAPAE